MFVVIVIRLFPFQFTQQHSQILFIKHDANKCGLFDYSSKTNSSIVYQQSNKSHSTVKSVSCFRSSRLFISRFLSVPRYLHAQIVHNALHRDVRFADLHPDRGDLGELEQRGLCDRVRHRLQEVVRRAFDDILSNPAEEAQSRFIQYQEISEDTLLGTQVWTLK
jgi:hypothetical protein